MGQDNRKFVLPVEALNNNVISFIENVHNLLQTVKDEVNTNDFSKTITFERCNGVDRDSSEIYKKSDDKYHVIMHTNYAQYLWGTCIYLLVQFDNLIQIPMMDLAGVNHLGLKTNMEAVKASMNVFKRSRGIMYEYNQDVQWQEPNILSPGVLQNDIANANGMYCGAMAFIYSHELSHNYYGHPTYNPETSEQSKTEELDADNLAIKLLLDHVPNFIDFTYKAGIVAVMSSMLLLDKDGVCGGNSHPDVDVRLDNAIRQLKLSDKDNLWGMACFAINSYLQNYGFLFQEEIAKTQQMAFDTYKDMYEYYIKRLSKVKVENF